MSEIIEKQPAISTGTKRLIMIGSIVIGIILIVIAIVYFLLPASGLPAFFPGYDQTLSAHHWKHGLLALILGAGAFVLAWFNSGSTQKKQQG